MSTRAGELADYAAEVIGQPLLQWELDLAGLMLQVDVDGRWCRRTWLVIAPRQSAKSAYLRALAEWLASQGGMVLSSSARLVSVAHLMRPTQARYRSVEGYRILFSKEQPEVAWPGATEEARRWVGQAATSMLGRGFTADTVLIDEVQDVPPEALEAVRPTMTEVDNPLVVMCGTGARVDSQPLLAEQRALALAGGPVALAEWSAPVGADWLDEEVWRAASPRWSRARLRQLREDVALGQAYIRSEYLCQLVSAPGSEPWLDLSAWGRARTPLDLPEQVQVVAVEDARGGVGGCVALAWSRGGKVHVLGLATASLPEAWALALRGERVLCGITLRNEESAVSLHAKPVGRRETSTALPELRRLLAMGGLVWDGEDLDQQVRTVRVREDAQGALAIGGRGEASGVLRAAAWAVQSVRITREPVMV